MCPSLRPGYRWPPGRANTLAIRPVPLDRDDRRDLHGVGPAHRAIRRCPMRTGSNRREGVARRGCFSARGDATGGGGAVGGEGDAHRHRRPTARGLPHSGQNCTFAEVRLRTGTQGARAGGAEMLARHSSRKNAIPDGASNPQQPQRIARMEPSRMLRRQGNPTPVAPFPSALERWPSTTDGSPAQRPG